MKILVINCGSSSIKFKVFDNDRSEGLTAIAEGLISELGNSDARLRFTGTQGEVKRNLDCPDHQAGLEAILQTLQDSKTGAVKDLAEIKLVGHRTVHGGDKFTGAVLVTPDVIRKMEQCIPLAPVHNPANLEGIRITQEMLPQARHVAVFDTAFHQTLPQHAYLYGLPYELFEKHGIRKYGFHGTSCRYVYDKALKLTGKTDSKGKTIICHLGNGITIAAVKDGQSIDTSLGMTPLEGPIMGTRCGDLDPGVLLFLQRELKLPLAKIDQMLNRESGLLGISGKSNDMRQLLAAAEEGDQRCQLAIQVFTYRLKKYIGAYAAALGGIDLLIFTGGVGENSPLIRELILEQLEFLGLHLDPQRNRSAGADDTLLSVKDATVDIVLVHTNEELMIARESLAVIAA